MKEVIIVRHAESYYNVQETQNLDSNLTLRGAHQAKAAAEYLAESKDAEGFLSAFRGLARHVVTVQVPGEDASLGAGALYDMARAAGLDAAPGEDLEDAMLQIAARAQMDVHEAPPRILICGSLYLAGRVLAENR